MQVGLPLPPGQIILKPTALFRNRLVDKFLQVFPIVARVRRTASRFLFSHVRRMDPAKPLLKVAPENKLRRKFICDIWHEWQFLPVTRKNFQQFPCGGVAQMDNQRTISQGILEKVSNLPPRLIPTMPSLIMV